MDSMCSHMGQILVDSSDGFSNWRLWTGAYHMDHFGHGDRHWIVQKDTAQKDTAQHGIDRVPIDDDMDMGKNTPTYTQNTLS